MCYVDPVSPTVANSDSAGSDSSQVLDLKAGWYIALQHAFLFLDHDSFSHKCVFL